MVIKALRRDEAPGDRSTPRRRLRRARRRHTRAKKTAVAMRWQGNRETEKKKRKGGEESQPSPAQPIKPASPAPVCSRISPSRSRLSSPRLPHSHVSLTLPAPVGGDGRRAEAGRMLERRRLPPLPSARAASSGSPSPSAPLRPRRLLFRRRSGDKTTPTSGGGPRRRRFGDKTAAAPSGEDEAPVQIVRDDELQDTTSELPAPLFSPSTSLSTESSEQRTQGGGDALTPRTALPLRRRLSVA